MTFETIECGPIITNYFDISKKATKLSLLQAKTYVNKLEKILSKRIKGTSFYINDTRDALISFIMDYYPNLDEDEDNIILHNRNILDRIRGIYDNRLPYQHKNKIISYIRNIITEDLHQTLEGKST